jgi:RES domain
MSRGCSTIFKSVTSKGLKRTFTFLARWAILAFMLRIFDPTRHGTTALSFRYFGPLGRFDHQRLSPTGSSSEDPDRGISYAGLTLSCCLVECFGDVGVIEIKGQQIARLELTRDLTLLDLRGSGAMRAGAVAALAKIADRNLSQAWSRYFYERTADYGQLDGISYLNAHNDEEAIAIYERAQSALVCTDAQILPLNHPSLRPAILEAALTNHLNFLA